MIHLTSLPAILSVFQLSQGLTEFHFSSTAICQNFTGFWCVKAYHLQRDTFTYDDLGVSEPVCFNGPASTTFKNIAYLSRNDKPYYRTDFNIHVGFRHNCTFDGDPIDYEIRIKYVNPWSEYENIKTIAVIDNKGWNHDWLKWAPTWKPLKFEVEYFTGTNIEAEKFYIEE